MEKIVVGNLKMNLDENEVENYISFLNNEEINNVNLLIAPSYIYLDKFKSNKYKLVAQNVSYFDDGDYTGEVSANQLKSLGVDYVILGHSERRNLFNETDDIIKKKIDICIKNDLGIILCIGEKREQDNDKTLNFIIKKLDELLKDVKDFSNIIIAYEPEYAISNKPAKIDNIDYIIKEIKKHFNDLHIKVIYGGSVSDKNFSEILEISDGVIIGKLSLNPKIFLNMIKNSNNSTLFDKNS